MFIPPCKQEDNAFIIPFWDPEKPWLDCIFISRDGRLWRKRKRGKRLKEIFPEAKKNRAKCIRLRQKGRDVQYSLAHMMLLSFFGPPQEGQIAFHLKELWDDSLENLCWLTPAEAAEIRKPKRKIPKEKRDIMELEIKLGVNSSFSSP